MLDRIPFGTGWVAAVKMELLPHEKFGGKITRDGASNTTIQLALSRKSKEGKETKLALFFGDADRQEINRYTNTEPVVGLLNGWRIAARDSAEPHTAVWLFDRPVKLTDGDRLVVSLKSDNVGCRPAVDFAVRHFKPEFVAGGVRRRQRPKGINHRPGRPGGPCRLRRVVRTEYRE